jgi:hypothetical protein
MAPPSAGNVLAILLPLRTNCLVNKFLGFRGCHYVVYPIWYVD